MRFRTVALACVSSSILGVALSGCAGSSSSSPGPTATDLMRDLPPIPKSTALDGGPVDTLPVPVHTEHADYPREARMAEITGKVLVEAIVDEAGNVRDASILESNPVFDQVALDAVRKWKFEPALRDGTPVVSRVAVPLVFTLSR